jgi:steroid delta-isomerase-like uncharacterized protein
MPRVSQIWDRFETALTKMDYDGAVNMFVPDCVYFEPAGRHEGREGVRAWLDEWGRGFAETNVKASLVIEDDDVIVAQWTYRSVNTGPIRIPDGSLLPATGKTLNLSGMTVLTLSNGQIVTGRDYWDQLDGLVQLGLMPGV